MYKCKDRTDVIHADMDLLSIGARLIQIHFGPNGETDPKKSKLSEGTLQNPITFPDSEEEEEPQFMQGNGKEPAAQPFDIIRSLPSQQPRVYPGGASSADFPPPPPLQREETLSVVREFPNVNKFKLLKLEEIYVDAQFMSLHKKKRLHQGVFYMCDSLYFTGCVQGSGMYDDFQNLLRERDTYNRKLDVITVLKPLYFLKISDASVNGFDRPWAYSTHIATCILTGKKLEDVLEPQDIQEKGYKFWDNKVEHDRELLKTYFESIIFRYENRGAQFSKKFQWDWGNSHLRRMNDIRMKNKISLINDKDGNIIHEDIYFIVKDLYERYMDPDSPLYDIDTPIDFDTVFPLLANMFWLDGFSASREIDNPLNGEWYNREYTFIYLNPFEKAVRIEGFSQRKNIHKQFIDHLLLAFYHNINDIYKNMKVIREDITHIEYGKIAKNVDYFIKVLRMLQMDKLILDESKEFYEKIIYRFQNSKFYKDVKDKYSFLSTEFWKYFHFEEIDLELSKLVEDFKLIIQGIVHDIIGHFGRIDDRMYVELDKKLQQRAVSTTNTTPTFTPSVSGEPDFSTDQPWPML